MLQLKHIPCIKPHVALENWFIRKTRSEVLILFTLLLNINKKADKSLVKWKCPAVNSPNVFQYPKLHYITSLLQEFPPLAPHDRSPGTSKQMGKEHGEVKQSTRDQTHQSRLCTNFGELHTVWNTCKYEQCIK